MDVINEAIRLICFHDSRQTEWRTIVIFSRAVCNLISKQPVVLIILQFCDFHFIIYINTFIFLFYSHLSAVEPLTIAYFLLINIFNIKRVCRKLTIDHRMKIACASPLCSTIKTICSWSAQLRSESKSDAFIRWMMPADGTQCYPQLIGKMYRFGYMPIKISSNSSLLAACLADYPTVSCGHSMRRKTLITEHSLTLLYR